MTKEITIHIKPLTENSKVNQDDIVATLTEIQINEKEVKIYLSGAPKIPTTQYFELFYQILSEIPPECKNPNQTAYLETEKQLPKYQNYERFRTALSRFRKK